MTRKWEGFCSAEVEETIKEIDRIYGDGKNDTSRDWGSMRDIAAMVVQYRAIVNTPRTEVARTPSAQFVAAVRAFVGGGMFDLTDSPNSLVSSLQRILKELDEAEAERTGQYELGFLCEAWGRRAYKCDGQCDKCFRAQATSAVSPRGT